MFQVGDKVVPNGFRFCGKSHRFGTVEEMERWEREKQVLVARIITKDGDVRVSEFGNEDVELERLITYHPSELRIATEREVREVAYQNIGTREPAAKSLPDDVPMCGEFRLGTLVNCAGVYFVITGGPDSNGDYELHNAEEHYWLPRGAFLVVGVDTPAKAEPKLELLKPGDFVRSAAYCATGVVFCIYADDSFAVAFPSLSDWWSCRREDLTKVDRLD